MKKQTKKTKSNNRNENKAAAQEATRMEKIKQSFSEGVSEGRQSFLKKLLEIKGVGTAEIQKLYSSGLMEPEILKDITIGDLIKTTGIGMDFARSIKEILLRKESDLPFEYEKREVDRIKKETKDILSETVKIRNEMQQLDKQYNSLQSDHERELNKKNRMRDELEKFRDDEKKAYFNEKRIQDEMMFFMKEQDMFQQEVDNCAKGLNHSEKKLNNIKREFLFTKGECNFIREKINYLVDKLDEGLKVRGISQNKLTSFLNELRRVHDTLADAYKKTSVGYYANRQ